MIQLLLSFQARQIVGSAILVKAGDRPEIEADEFYSLDLVGMRVIVKVHTVFFLLQVIAASLVDFSCKIKLQGQLKGTSYTHCHYLIREI